MLDEAQAIAREYYDDGLPYHNWEHVQDTLDAAEDLLARCWQYDVDVDDDVVRYALLFHDAEYRWGFHNAEAMGYNSMEAYSASIARDELTDLGLDSDTVDRVAAAIRATEPDTEMDADTPNEWKVVRAADLRGLMADYATFEENSLALKEEHERLTGEQPTMQDWADRVEDTLEHYLTQDIRLTPEHDTPGGTSEFHANARRNLQKFRDTYG